MEYYKVVNAKSLVDLESKVDELRSENWYVTGNLVVISSVAGRMSFTEYVYLQPMVRGGTG